MNIRILSGPDSVNTEVTLPASKSISNRALMIRKLTGENFTINNLSDADDTKKLFDALETDEEVLYAGLGGTTARFLLAFAAIDGKGRVVDGDPVLRKRPVGALVEALRILGADVEYLGEHGFLPVRVKSTLSSGGKLEVDASVSSQFISALMLIGPCIEGGLTLKFSNEVLSRSYLNMTAIVMKDFGADVSLEHDKVTIKGTGYTGRDYFIEPDWSAASYWYEIAALSENAEIRIPALVDTPLQGDRKIMELMKALGVVTTIDERGVTIRKKQDSVPVHYWMEEMEDSPDLGPACIASSAALGITADFPGLRNFRIKESDRAYALQRELYKFRVRTDFCGGSKFKVYPHNGLDGREVTVKTYNDHRIAMCMAPLVLKAGSIVIEDADVVSKSYPLFWDDLQNAGFVIEEL